MLKVRMFGPGVVLAMLASVAVAMLPGCDGGGSSESGTTVTVDKAETENRAAKIRDMYKANPPAKGPRGELPAGSK